jgi:hypothetical protein
MKNVHLVIPDLFLPQNIAAETCTDLRLPALEKLLARGTLMEPLALDTSLENVLCKLFSSDTQEQVSIASISAKFDQLEEGFWLRSDPVHLSLQRDKMMLATVSPSDEEAAVLCASLNEYFSEQGITFFAPHPQRWYIRLDSPPRMHTTALSQVISCNVRGALPVGEDATYWHGILNEIQIFLFTHPLNTEREGRGELPINSVWLWGEGTETTLRKNYDAVSSDDTLPAMLASAVNTPFSQWEPRWCQIEGRQLLVWTALRAALQQGNFIAWRNALQNFEESYAQPLWQALRSGEIAQLQIDTLGENQTRRTTLTRTDTWAFWRRTKCLSDYSLV